MSTVRTDEFRKDAVRIALTSGLSRRQVADDLGVGLSTLNKWVNAHRDTDVVSAEDRELARENERLRREIRVIPPFLAGCIRRIHTAIFSFCAGVMPPMPMFGRSLL